MTAADRLAAHVTNAAASSPAAFVGVLLAFTETEPAPARPGLWAVFSHAFMRGYREHRQG